MLKIAIPSTLQQGFVSIGNIIIQSIINSFGSDVIAGYAAAVKLNNMVITTFTMLGMVSRILQHRISVHRRSSGSVRAARQH